MANLPARRPSWPQQAWAWLASPQPVRIRPLTAGLVGAAAVLLLFAVRTPETGPQPIATIGGGPANVHTVAATQPAIIYVQFVLADRAAKAVAVAGDFNSWEVGATQLADPDGDGVWTGLVALRPGSHKYMFVVDGKKWITDPQAERYIDDDFGMRNAVITVTPPAGKSI